VTFVLHNWQVSSPDTFQSSVIKGHMWKLYVGYKSAL